MLIDRIYIYVHSSCINLFALIDDTNLHAAIGTLMCNISQIVTKILISHLLSVSFKKR